MKILKSFFSVLLLFSLLLSICSCKKEEPQAVFPDKPFVKYAYTTGNYAPPFQAKCEFEHSIYKYYDDALEGGDDWTPSYDHIGFTLYYGWQNSYLDAAKFMLGVSEDFSTSVYFENDCERILVNVNEKSFWSDDFKYYSYQSILYFTHHQHMAIPYSLYYGYDEGHINVCVYGNIDESERLLLRVTIYFERHGEELWFANNPNVFDNYN